MPPERSLDAEPLHRHLCHGLTWEIYVLGKPAALPFSSHASPESSPADEGHLMVSERCSERDGGGLEGPQVLLFSKLRTVV